MGVLHRASPLTQALPLDGGGFGGGVSAVQFDRKPLFSVMPAKADTQSLPLA